jgi:hypothetical protein
MTGASVYAHLFGVVESIDRLCAELEGVTRRLEALNGGTYLGDYLHGLSDELRDSIQNLKHDLIAAQGRGA